MHPYTDSTAKSEWESEVDETLVGWIDESLWSIVFRVREQLMPVCETDGKGSELSTHLLIHHHGTGIATRRC
jgi:hypothetical protein